MNKYVTTTFITARTAPSPATQQCGRGVANNKFLHILSFVNLQETFMSNSMEINAYFLAVTRYKETVCNHRHNSEQLN